MPTVQHSREVADPLVQPPRMRVICRTVRADADGGPSWNRPAERSDVAAERMRWGVDGEITTLSLRCAVASGATAWPATGDEIRLVDDSPDERAWFVGHVGQESVLIQSNPDREARTLVAYGPEIRLRAKAVHGQWCKRPAADDAELDGTLTGDDAVIENVFCADLPTVFNADGRPNASQSAIGWALAEGGGDCRVFEPADRVAKRAGGSEVALAAEHWTAYAALRSLVEYVDGYEVISPATDWTTIAAVLGEAVLGEVVVEGKTLGEAMRAILAPLGFGFYLEPWPADEASGRSRHRLGVFNRHASVASGQAPILADNAAGRLSMADPAGQAAMVQRLEFMRDSHNVANEVTVIGDLRRVQACLEWDPSSLSPDLSPAWPVWAHDLEDWAVGAVIPEMHTVDMTEANAPDAESFMRRYNRGGEEHLANVDVFRTFVWNEDGAYRSMGARTPDLSGVLGTGDYARRPRPMGPTLLEANDGGAGVLPAYVEIGIVDDDDAWVLLPAAKVLGDRAGFTITASRLDTLYPYAHAPAALRDTYYLGPGRYSLATLLYNALRGESGEGRCACRFRLIGTVAADQAVTGRATYRLDSTWPLKAQRVEYRPELFKHSSIAGGANPAGRPDVARDDSALADDFAARTRDAVEDAMGHGSMMLRALCRHIRPGMAWRKTGGRAVDLEVSGGDQRYAATVVGLTWIFAEGAAKTEVILDSPLLQVSP